MKCCEQMYLCPDVSVVEMPTHLMFFLNNRASRGHTLFRMSSPSSESFLQISPEVSEKTPVVGYLIKNLLLCYFVLKLHILQWLLTV